MELTIRTDEVGSGSITVDGPIHDAVITRGMGNLSLSEDHGKVTLSVLYSAPSDAVGVEYGDESGHRLLCPFCLVPQDPHTICEGAAKGIHPMHIRPFHIHHEDDEISNKGHEQVEVARNQYGKRALAQRLVNDSLTRKSDG